MHSAIQFEDRVSRSRSKHEGESSASLCDRLSRTRVQSQRQLPTDHDHAVPTREYQLDQSSPLPATAAADLVLEVQRQKQPQRFADVDRSHHIREGLSTTRELARIEPRNYGRNLAGRTSKILCNGTYSPNPVSQMASADTRGRRWIGSSIWLHDVCSERSGSRRPVGSPGARTRHRCRTASGENRPSLMRSSPVRCGWSNVQLHGSRKLLRSTYCLGCGRFSCGDSGVRHRIAGLHENHALIQSTIGEELCMGLRPTYMDENRLEPKRYHRTGAGRQRPSRLWIS